jgi:coenzyme F420-dependent glucose-6-phosphate dehydrogenase
MIGTSPETELFKAFDDHGGGGKPRYGQVTVCWAGDERRAVETAMRWWPTAALKGELTQELPAPRHFEQAVALVTEDELTKAVVCGPDPERHAEAIRRYADAGYDHVFVHQVGPDQIGGLRFYAEEVRPRLDTAPVRKAG